MDSSIINALERIRASLIRALGRGRIKTGDDSGGVQLLQVQLNDREIRDNTPRVGEYGFASMPLPGCQALVVFVGGDRSNGAVIGTNDETHRLKNLQPGEVAIYDDLGRKFHFTRSGPVIDCNGAPLQILNCPSLTHDGVNIGKTHTHPDPQGGNTGGPQ